MESHAPSRPSTHDWKLIVFVSAVMLGGLGGLLLGFELRDEYHACVATGADDCWDVPIAGVTVAGLLVGAGMGAVVTALMAIAGHGGDGGGSGGTAHGPAGPTAAEPGSPATMTTTDPGDLARWGAIFGLLAAVSGLIPLIGLGGVMVFAPPGLVISIIARRANERAGSATGAGRADLGIALSLAGTAIAALWWYLLGGL